MTGDARHERAFYEVRLDALPATGERMLIACRGGPSTSRLEVFAPRLELSLTEGLYVLDDDGPLESWH